MTYNIHICRDPERGQKSNEGAKREKSQEIKFKIFSPFKKKIYLFIFRER